MRLIGLAVLAPFAVAAAPPVDGSTRDDVRCLVAVVSLTASEDTEVKLAGLLGSQYFLGRIDGRDPDLDIEAAIRQEQSHLDEAEISSLLRSCGQLMQDRGEALEAIGNRLDQDQAPSSPAT